MDQLLNLDVIEPYMTVQIVEHTNIITVKRKEGHSPDVIVDQWTDWLIDLMNRWPREKAFLMMHDFRESSISNYVQEKARESVPLIPDDLNGRYAAIANKSPVGRMVALLFNYYARRMVKGLQLRLFYDEASALQWLKDFEA